MAKKNPTPAEITIMAAGVVALVFSFLNFYKNPFTDNGVSAWSSGLFPVASLMVVFVVLMAIAVAISRFTNAQLPDLPYGFSWNQLHLVLGFFATIYAIAYLVVSKGGLDFGIGFWFILIACIASLVGAVLLQRESTASGRGPLA